MTSRLLVVDDDAVALRALCMLLEQDGYEVVALASGALALQALQSQPFDAVVTDLEMPGVHGFEVVKAAGRRAIPTLVVTAYAGQPSSQAALDLGARRIFGKPVPYEALTTELARSVAPPR